MSRSDIAEEVRIELKNLNIVIVELNSLLKENQFSEPLLKDKTAVGSYLAQFYNGIENILKRICRLKNINLP